MIELRPVTRENIDEVLSLSVKEDQRGFVSTTAQSLAQAYVYRDTAFPFAVYDDRDIVGFIMMGYYEEKAYYTLWKLLIDKERQHKGYGRKALELGISFLKDRYNASEIYTGVSPGNTIAKRLYLSMGFEETGLFENGMEELRLDVGKQRKDIVQSRITIREERISAEEYTEFLKRTDLGSQYPKERFDERITKLVKNVNISLIARNTEGRIVGVLFGLTDFCYWLYITDLGVDRDYERQGIATRLMKEAHEKAGGEKDIAVYLIVNENAVPFYRKLGMEFADDVMQYNHIEWTEWTVGESE